MADILNFYADIDFKEIALSPPVGVASITGESADLSTWSNIGQYTYDTGFYRRIYRKSINAQSGIVLGGTGALATIFSPENWVTGENPKLQDGIWKNCFFINVHDTAKTPPPNNWRGIYLEIFGSQYEQNGVWHFKPVIRIGNYRAIPDSEISTKSERIGYKYYTGTDYEFAAEASANSWDSNSQFNQICMYSCVVNETEYFLFVMGVNNGQLHPSNTSTAVLIPRSYFKYNIPKPYVGPVSKESAESAYITGSRPKNNVEPRTLTNKNMFGFNADGVFLTKISESQYRMISSEIYNGLSGNALNALGQVVSTVVGGNSRRPAEEIRTIIDGVFCCHAVPNANRFPTTGTVQLSTICGYDMFSREFPLQTIDRWEQWEIASGVIPRPSGSFLDFSPYTTVTLSIPILGNIDIDPSALLGNALSLWFTLDAFTGSLSCDISIVENGVKWIYSTLQGNCAVELPMIGAGQNANPLLKIAGGVSSIFTGGAQNIPNAIINVYDGIQQAAYTRPISRVQSSNILPIVAPTDIYLTITTPNNVNAGDYWTLAGIPSHMSGNVGDFRGFTVFEHVDLSGVSGATESELSEIESSLKGGVWL